MATNGTTKASSSCAGTGIGHSANPFIRSHVTDLVRWNMLDDDAVAKAKAENKVIFMHIGYAACHYCRLTTQDSFNHAAVARFLNSHFVPVIVDRDERPDLNHMYQNYNQAVNPGASGGWPLHVFLTPELLPVFAGSYWPGPGTEHSATLGNGSDFLVSLQKVHASWRDQERRLRAEAQQVVTKLADFAAEGVRGAGACAEHDGHGLADDLDLDLLEEAVVRLARTYDTQHGGFGHAPKHPLAPKLSFLLRLASFPQEARDVVDGERVAFARVMALQTLRRLRDGGLRDHAGRGGFHRYSQTADWGLPRFEKMVADNALLLGVFLDAWLLQAQAQALPTRELEFADMVFELADYLIAPPICVAGGKGGFATSEASDSFSRHGDSHMREGGCYLWTRKEFDAVVGGGSGSSDGGGGGGGHDDDDDDGAHACAMAAAHFGVREHGNVPRAMDLHDEFLNQNVLQITGPSACTPALARQFGVSEAEAARVLHAAQRRLREHRERERPRPATDTKAMAAVNGMVIGALARTAAAVRHVDAKRARTYLDAAREAAEFVKRDMWDEERQVLYRISAGGRRGDTRGFAEDYAFVIEGVLDLAEALRGSVFWIAWARQLQDRQVDLFHDVATGGFFSTEAHAPHTLLRLKEGMDAERPSANAVSADNLFRLARLVGRPEYDHLARATVNAFEPELLQYPWLFPGLLAGLVAGRLGVHVDEHWGTRPRAQARVGREHRVEPGAGMHVPAECLTQ